MTVAICSLRARIRSAMRWQAAARSKGGVSRQPSQALRADSTARFTSRADACGIEASNSPVAGLTTSIRWLESELTHCPPIKSFGDGRAAIALSNCAAEELTNTSFWNHILSKQERDSGTPIYISKV